MTSTSAEPRSFGERRGLYLAGLMLALIPPSIGMALTADAIIAALYVVIACAWVAVYYFWIAPIALNRMSNRSAVIITVVVLAVLAVAVAIIHPLIDTAGFSLFGREVGAADNDNAVDLGVDAILQGENPYERRTFLGAPIGPLPGAFVLGLPFYLMGDVAYASIFFLGLFWFLAARQGAPAGTLLLILAFTASPALVYQALAGMDYTTDIMAVIGFSVLVIHWGDRQLLLILAAGAVGIAMATRINLTLLAVPLLVILINRYGKAPAITAALSLSFGFLAISVPFFLWDPSNFSPIQAGAVKADALPFGALLTPGIGVVVAVLLAFTFRHNDELDFFRDAFWIQSAVIGLTIASRFLADDPLASNYFTYAILALYPGALFFWARLLGTNHKNRRATEPTREELKPVGNDAPSTPDDLVPGT